LDGRFVRDDFRKNYPQNKISVFIVFLIGTVLATNLINNEVQLDWHGIMWGMLAAASFTTTMFTANSASD
jgi:high-affinity nickel permease